MRNPLRALTPLGGLTVLLAACSSGGTAGSDPGTAHKDTLIIGTGATPQTLDPQLSSDVQTDMTSTPMYDTILGYDAADRLTPALATSWKVSDDTTSVELTLRSDVKFHDGTPLTAKDVVYTLNRVHKLGIGIASVIPDYTSATAADSTHVTITLAKPNSTFLGALSRIYVVNSALVQAHAGSDGGQAWLATHEAGSGAYTLASYTANQQIRFQAYPGYFNKTRGKVKTLVYRYITESATIRDELRNGGIDIAYGLTPTDQATFKSDPRFTTTEVKSSMQLYGFFNNLTGPTADLRVRQAIRLAYDYKGHVSGILHGNGEVASGPMPKAVSCRPQSPDSAQNIAQAKQLLAAAGAKNLALTMYYQPYLAEHAAAATLLQSNLRDIGVTLKLKPVTYPQLVKSLSSKTGAPDMVLVWDFPLYPDPTGMLYRVYDSRFVGTGSNYGMYANPKVDALLGQALKTPTADAACALDKQAEQIINDDAVSMNIASSKTIYVARKGISGFAFSPTHILLDTAAFTVS